MKQKILAQGAEAKIVLNEDTIIKKRIKKSYRIPQLDEKIRKLRTRSETKLLEKASKVINAPKIIKSNENTKEIEMEFINGKRLSENLNKLSLQEQKDIAKKIAEILFNEILKSYTKSKDSKLVLEQLKKVEKRGRYKN